jgi:hypothetical protein
MPLNAAVSPLGATGLAGKPNHSDGQAPCVSTADIVLPPQAVQEAGDPDERQVRESLTQLRQCVNGRGISIVITAPTHAARRDVARRLDEILALAGIPSGVVHLYRWWDQLFATPGILYRNRVRRRRVLVFERTIFDNVARLLGRARLTRGLIWPALWLMRWLYPRFDYLFYVDGHRGAEAVDRDAGEALARLVASATGHRYIAAQGEPVREIVLRLA